MSSDAPAGTGIFARDRSVAVADRTHPEFDARGLPLGTFRLYPALALGLGYDDNLYGIPGQKTGDASLQVKPSLQIRSDAQDYSVTARASGRVERYFDQTSENIEDWSAGAEGEWEVAGRTRVSAGADWSRQHESRLSENIFAFTRRPIAYDTLTGKLGISSSLGRIRLSAVGRIAEIDYADAELADGTPVNQDSRDNTTKSLRGRIDFALNPDIAFFVQGTADWRDFKAVDVLTPIRNSRGYEVLGGASFEQTDVLRGEIGIGYLVQDFDSAFYTDFSGLGLKAKVEWFPTLLTTVTATGSRTVSDSGIPGSGGYLTTRGGLRVDHELLRNLIVSASADYQRDRFNNLDRRDSRIGAGTSARWQLNPALSLALSYSHLSIDSTGADRYRDLSDNRLTATVVIRR